VTRVVHRWLAGAGAAATGCVLALGPAVSSAATSAPLNGREWWFDAWHIQDRVWPRTQGAGVTIALLDSGVSAALPDLTGTVLPGYNAHTGSGDGRHDTDPAGHGTEMASLIVAQGKGTGMLGIAPKAKVLPVIEGDSLGNTTTTEIVTAIRWAADHDAMVIEMAFVVDGTRYLHGCPLDVQLAVNYAVERDVVLVAGAGNDGAGDNGVKFPAACAGVVAVGAVDRQAQPWIGSQRQPYVDVAAPGVDTVVLKRNGQLDIGGAGTSDASALTAAGIALIRSAHPELNGRQVVARLLARLRDRPASGKKDPQRGYGTILLDKAVNDDIPLDAPNPIYDELRDKYGVGPTSSPSTPRSSSPQPSSPPTGASPAQPSGGTPIGLVAALAGGVAVLIIAVVATTTRRRRAPPPASHPHSGPPRPAPPYQPPPAGPTPRR